MCRPSHRHAAIQGPGDFPERASLLSDGVLAIIWGFAHSTSALHGFSERHGSVDEHASGISTAVSPVTSPSRPLSKEAGKTYTDLTGPSYSSTPADRQNRRGTRRFTSPVPSSSTSSKRARMDDDSADMRLFLNSSVSSSSTSPYDELPDDDAVESAAMGPAADGPGSSVGTSRATCNLHSRPGWTGTSRNTWRSMINCQ